MVANGVNILQAAQVHTLHSSSPISCVLFLQFLSIPFFLPISGFCFVSLAFSPVLQCLPMVPFFKPR